VVLYLLVDGVSIVKLRDEAEGSEGVVGVALHEGQLVLQLVDELTADQVEVALGYLAVVGFSADLTLIRATSWTENQ
jgi:hypothetical protein